MFRNDQVRKWLYESSSCSYSSSTSSEDDLPITQGYASSVLQTMKRKLMDDSSSSSSSSEDGMGTDELETQESTYRNKGYRPRSEKRASWPCKRGPNGELVPLQPKESIWWTHYVENPPLDSQRFRRTFRHRFRLPYESFVALASMIVAETTHFEKWEKKDAVGRDASPIELLLLGTLRYLGRGAKLDDMEENTAISAETHRLFLHAFLEFGSTTLHEKFVVFPNTIEDAHVHQIDFADAGLPGCIGSMDATHVAMHNCPAKVKNLHDSFKQSLPSRTYNMVASHRRRILHSTNGLPSRYNDKTVVLFDVFVKKVHEGELLSDYQFYLLQEINGKIRKVRYSGVWFLVDNGYLNWSITVPPFKDPTTYPQRRWSKWVESIRKDVECTFGIIKKRFQCLQHGVRLHGMDNVDKFWLTCCAIHNMLLDADGQNDNWNGSVDSEYVRNLGLTAGCQTERNLQVDVENLEIENETPVPVRSLTMGVFRERLVEHFDLMWRAKLVKWPARS